MHTIKYCSWEKKKELNPTGTNCNKPAVSGLRDINRCCFHKLPLLDLCHSNMRNCCRQLFVDRQVKARRLCVTIM